MCFVYTVKVCIHVQDCVHLYIHLYVFACACMCVYEITVALYLITVCQKMFVANQFCVFRSSKGSMKLFIRVLQ